MRYSLQGNLYSCSAVSIKSVCALLIMGFSPFLFGFKWQSYPSLQDIALQLASIEQRYPELATIVPLGQSQQGRDIVMLRISDQINDRTNTPAIFINATHHGNEKASTAVAMAFAERLLADSSEDFYRYIIENFQILVQPVVNPDGYSAKTRGDSANRDLNRQYPVPDETQMKLPLPENRHTRHVLSQFPVIATVTLHSGMEGVLWPWCHKKTPTKDHEQFYMAAKTVAEAMGIKLYRQSYHDYPTIGEYIDYAYSYHDAFALTVEVSSNPSPIGDQLMSTQMKGIRGLTAFLNFVAKMDQERIPPPLTYSASASLELEDDEAVLSPRQGQAR